MKIYELPEPKDYQSFINFYRNVMREGKEEEAFLGTDAKYRIRERDSYELDSTDILVLMEYCLFPLYAEGDKDIVRRTFEILKEFSLSNDLMRLKKVMKYISIQSKWVKKYTSLPFVIETDGLELETVTQLNDIISKLSSVTKSYKKLLAQDAKNLEVIKSEWMALDSFIGLHGEWISGSNKIGNK